MVRECLNKNFYTRFFCIKIKNKVFFNIKMEKNIYIIYTILAILLAYVLYIHFILLPRFLTKTDASTNYLSITDAINGIDKYLTIEDAINESSKFLTIDDASARYLTKTEASIRYSPIQASVKK